MKKLLIVFGLAVAAVACNQTGLTPGPGMDSGKILFVAGGPAVTATVSTKATAVTVSDLNTNGFKVNAVKGSAGTDVEVWSNQLFTKVEDVWEQDKWWPNDDQSYRFYATYPTSYAMTFAAGGPTISASNANDIICAYKGDAIYKSVNTLAFDHIFARLRTVTVSMVSPYTISNMSIMITPKVSGTYNLYTGSGQTDGTGWSSTVEGTATNIATAAFSEGVSMTNNDIYLVPGTYTLSATWTATKDNYTQTFTNKTVDVALVAGKTNNITASLTGDGTEIQFNVSVTAWSDNAVNAGTFPVTDPAPVQPAHSINGKFTVNDQGGQVWFSEGNLQCTIVSGPTNEYNYVGTDWCFATNQWDCFGDSDGANSFTVGKKMDLFGWVGESASYDTFGLCSLTETNNAYYGTSDADVLKTDWGDIPGVISACGDGWYTLDVDEWGYVFNSRTSGVTVNGTPDARYTHATIRTDVSGVKGIILFPDDYSAGTPSGVTWGTINEGSYWSTQCTAAGWASLEAVGCVFLPAAGRRNGGGVLQISNGYYWSSSPSDVDTARGVILGGGYVSLQDGTYRMLGYSVRLVKAVE